MAQEAEDPGLFDTTRGKLLLLLCEGQRTVNELMEALGVTDNAVRAHLANLQEDGLVRAVGLRPGTRKPHVDYELTPKARRLFPQAHEQVLVALVNLLRERLPAEQVGALFKDVARRLVGGWAGELRESDPRPRLDELLGKLRGSAVGVSLVQDGERTALSACGCPLASVTAEHPEVCRALAEVLGELLGTRVRERCDRRESPRCCFELDGEGPR
jgi:predicted ArsR family transcriptional regulator